MRILYDSQAFDLQRFGGVSKSEAETIKEMKKYADVTVGVFGTDNAYLLEMGYPTKEAALERLKRDKLVPDSVTVDAINWYALNLQYSMKLLSSGQFDIFQPTHYNPYFLNNIGQTPFVLTIHDMTDEKLDNYFQFNQEVSRKERANRKAIGLAANKIVAVSEYTKQDLLKMYKIESDRVAVSSRGYTPIREGFEYKEVYDFPYILYVGTRMGCANYKGFIPFLNQVIPFLKKHEEVKVVCTGGGPFTTFEKDMMRCYGVEDRFVQAYVDEDTLNNLYHGAICFVFPSEYEGFGLPILEAYQNDCLALLNNASCFPEVAGDAAIWFDLSDGKSLNEKLEKVMSMSKTTKDRLLKKQRARLKEFSWDNVAKAYYNTYKDILGHE